MSSPPAPGLDAIIRERIESERRITFRDFMEEALYHPRLGYYMTVEDKIGREGDYYTSPDVHRVFGVSLMKQFAELREIIAPEGVFHVIEAGAGKGSLALQILDAAKERDEELYDSLRYSIVEKSPSLRKLQEETLSENEHSGKVTWFESMAEALERAPEAVVFSNELIDAFPVHRAAFDGENWREIYVETSDDGFCEGTGPLSSGELTKALEKIGGDFNEGYTTEVNLDGQAWITEVGAHLKKGVVITIDYGYPAGDYYSPVRREGTLLCYYRHTLSDNPYERVGQQDMTAHVDFTALAEAGLKAGLEVSGFCEQFHFLMGLGVFDEFKAQGETFSGDAYAENLAIKKLLMPERMGGAFKVLVQHKGMEKPDLLSFSFKDLSHRL